VGSRENLDFFSEENGLGKTKRGLSVQSLYRHCYSISPTPYCTQYVIENI